MATPPKHARDMTQQEAATRLRELGATKSAASVPMTEWEHVATLIRKMSIPELGAFEHKYGISIVPNTKTIKKFHDMTPAEQDKFEAMHRIKVAR
jgi:hypothetical protein